MWLLGEDPLEVGVAFAAHLHYNFILEGLLVNIIVRLERGYQWRVYFDFGQ